MSQALKLTPANVLARFDPHDGTLESMLAARVRRLPDHPFIEYDGQTLSYARFAQQADAMAAMLWSRGVRAGDRVALLSYNHPSIPLTLFALARLGAVAVPINPDFLRDEARYVLEHAQVSGVICAPDRLALLEQACEGIERPMWKMVNRASDGVDVQDIESAMRESEGVRFDNASDPDRTCILIYSSGTTGFPKGVMHAQRTFTLAGEGFVARMHLQPDDRLLCIMPMFHMNAIFYSLAGALATGATLILLARFSASTFWRDAARLQATEVNTVAAISNILMRRPRSEFVPGHRIRSIYGGPFSQEVYRVFKSEFGVPGLVEGYGMSEIPGVLSNPIDGPRIGSIGLPCQHPNQTAAFAQLRIVGDDGHEVAADVPGNLLVKNQLVMQGYFRDPQLTAEVFKDGWFVTGDVVRRDAEGFYWFVARSKDIIRRRGENVSGAEIDRIVNEHPDVLMSAAIAVPSPVGEDDILVAVVAREGQQVAPEAIRQWCEARLARVKLPRYVAVVDALPHNRSFRIEKFKLKARSESLVASAVDFEPFSSTAHPQPDPP
ncbi:MAG: AMP-binding protein [Pseudomonadota bacterium]